jgi:hypothetical protein
MASVADDSRVFAPPATRRAVQRCRTAEDDEVPRGSERVRAPVFLRRLRSAILLLQWAIDRYRREKQAPMRRCGSDHVGSATPAPERGSPNITNRYRGHRTPSQVWTMPGRRLISLRDHDDGLAALDIVACPVHLHVITLG